MNSHTESGFHSSNSSNSSNNIQSIQATQSTSYAKMAQSVIIGTIISLFSSIILFIVFAFIINAAFGDPDIQKL